MVKKLAIPISFSLLLIAVMLFALAAQDKHAAKRLKANAAETKQKLAALSKQITALQASELKAQATTELPIKDESINDSVSNDEIKILLHNIDARMTNMELDVEDLRVSQHGQVQQALTLSNTEEENPLLSLIKANSNPIQQANIYAYQQQAYHLSLDQRITAEIDTLISDNVTVRFQDMFARKENWSNHINLDSAQCGGDLCKVTLNYDQKALAKLGVNELELDAAMIIPLAYDYPQSSVNYKINPDGTTKVIMYFTAKGTHFPRQ